jgi:hypothetical protein
MTMLATDMPTATAFKTILGILWISDFSILITPFFSFIGAYLLNRDERYIQLPDASGQTV